jgi:hypothetical protein
MVEIELALDAGVTATVVGHFETIFGAFQNVEKGVAVNMVAAIEIRINQDAVAFAIF